VLVLLTDGRASLGTDSVITPSELLREDGVNIFVVGIGQKLNKNELNIIASDPDEHHVVSSKTFVGVNSLVGNIQESSCYGECFAVLFLLRFTFSSVLPCLALTQRCKFCRLFNSRFRTIISLRL